MLQLQLYAYLMSGCVSGGIQENDHVTVDRLGLILAGILGVTLGNLEHVDGVFHTLIRNKARNAVSIGFCHVAGNVRAELNRDTLNGIAVGVVYQHAVALQTVGVAALGAERTTSFPSRRESMVASYWSTAAPDCSRVTPSPKLFLIRASLGILH